MTKEELVQTALEATATMRRSFEALQTEMREFGLAANDDNVRMMEHARARAAAHLDNYFDAVYIGASTSKALHS